MSYTGYSIDTIHIVPNKTFHEILSDLSDDPSIQALYYYLISNIGVIDRRKMTGLLPNYTNMKHKGSK